MQAKTRRADSAPEMTFEQVQYSAARYAGQYARGHRSLRFIPPIEKEFRADYLDENLGRMRIGFVVAIALYLVFLSVRLFAESGPPAAWGFGIRLSIIIALLITLVASRTWLREQLTVWVIGSYILFSTGVTAIEVLSQRYGIDRHYEGLLLITMHCYVFGGLLFRQACFVGAAILVIYAVGGWLGGLVGVDWSYQLLFIALINVIGVVALYTLEHRERSEFLARCALELETTKSELLLLSILPRRVAQRLKEEPTAIADSFKHATVLVADIVGFTSLSARLSPRELVLVLNNAFTEFDRIADRHGLEKIKTIGDAYMAVAGVPVPREDDVEAAADMALDMLECAQQIQFEFNAPLQLRIGIHCGPVVAGVIGTKKFSYDLWGDTVNLANLMESLGPAGAIQVSETVWEKLRGRYTFSDPRTLEIKGREPQTAYLLQGRAVSSSESTPADSSTVTA